MPSGYDMHRSSRRTAGHSHSNLRKDYLPMDSQKIKLKLEHISQSYIVGDKVFDAAVDVSFDVKDSEFLVILGPGRCGKPFC